LTSLANDATKSIYVTAQGKKVTFITPPPTFEASKASPAELELYGVLAEPSKGSPEYPKWKEMIDHGIHFVEPPEHLVQAASGSAQSSTPSLVQKQVARKPAARCHRHGRVRPA